MRQQMLLILAAALIAGSPSARPLPDATWSPNNENRRSQVSDKYDKAIDQALYDKKLERAMQNVCRGC